MQNNGGALTMLSSVYSQNLWDNKNLVARVCETTIHSYCLGIFDAERLTGGALRQKKKVGELLYCNNFDIEAVLDKMDRVKSRNRLVREGFSWMSRSKRFLNVC